MFKLNSQKEYLMNTYTNAVRPEEKADRTTHKNSSRTMAIMAFALALVILSIIATYTANRPIVGENNLAVPYSNALELQYARPWLEAQNKPAVEYGNALELQYARPWLEVQNKPVVFYGNALEMQYAQPWLDQAQQLIAVTGSVQEQNALDCGSSLEMFYGCKYGDGRP
jgi:hypothetical protein